jgi:hypothetical protein
MHDFEWHTNLSGIIENGTLFGLNEIDEGL